jgi:DNA-binding NarL/FixJ family response regulator
MPSTDSVSPVFYVLFGAFLVLLGLHLWRSLQQRFSSRDRLSAESKTFSVRIIDNASVSSNDRRWQWDTLTPREMQVADLAAHGSRNAEIARELHISTHTVETHLKHIYHKLHVRSRTELVQVIRDLVD